MDRLQGCLTNLMWLVPLGRVRGELGLGEIVPARPRVEGEGGAVVSTIKTGEGTVPAFRGGTSVGAGGCASPPGGGA